MSGIERNWPNLHINSVGADKLAGAGGQNVSEAEACPPIVLLHGWGRSSAMFGELSALLGDYQKVYLIDLPGHGQSALPEGVWGVADFANCLAKELKELGHSHYQLVGHSFGGKTAIKVSSLYPELVERLVLINSSGLRPERSVRKKIYFWLLGRFRTLVKLVDRSFKKRNFEEWFVPRFASVDYLNAGPLRATFVKSMNEELSGDARAIKCPTLLLWGEKDTETPLYMGEKLKRLIDAAELVVLKGKGHEPFSGPGAHLCMVHLKRFLELDKDTECREGIESLA